MSKRVQHIFVFVFVFSVFSLTLQASILNVCKANKILKAQAQQNPVTEEEEESHDSDESSNGEVVYLGHSQIGLFPVKHIQLSWENLIINYPSNSGKILIPPPRH